MGYRTAHGSYRKAGQTVVIEVQPPDELRQPDTDQMDVRLKEREATGRPFQKGNRAAAGIRPKLSLLGIDINKADIEPFYKACMLKAESYRRARVREFRITHGFVSVGVMALLSTASLALAASRYMYNRASTDGDCGLMKQASLLANDARQNELAAWELASREASAKTRLAVNQTPWMAEQVPTKRVRVKEEPQEPVQEEESVAPWQEGASLKER